MEKPLQSFKDLIVWQKSIVLANLVYKITERFPKEELYGLVSQMRRCAVSIPSNIAEGRERSTKKDFLQFLRIANGSASELETQVIIAQDLYVNISFKETHDMIIEVQKMLAGLIRKLSA